MYENTSSSQNDDPVFLLNAKGWILIAIVNIVFLANFYLHLGRVLLYKVFDLPVHEFLANKAETLRHRILYEIPEDNLLVGAEYLVILQILTLISVIGFAFLYMRDMRHRTKTEESYVTRKNFYFLASLAYAMAVALNFFLPYLRGDDVDYIGGYFTESTMRLIGPTIVTFLILNFSFFLLANPKLANKV